MNKLNIEILNDIASVDFVTFKASVSNPNLQNVAQRYYKALELEADR